MDGSDGLAGGMAAIGFAAYGLAAWWGDALALAAACVAISSAAVAFLLHNHHPARIFLGDVGSILRLLASPRARRVRLAQTCGRCGSRCSCSARSSATRRSRWCGACFGANAYGRRTATYYQRMVRMGFGHRATAWTGYAVMLVCAGAALFGRNQAPALQATAFRGERAARGVGSLGRPALDPLPARAGGRMKLRRLIVLAHDVVAAGLAWIAAFWLRFNFDLPRDYQELMLETLPWVLGVYAIIFVPGSLPRPVALRQPSRPAAHRGRGGHRRARGAGDLRFPAARAFGAAHGLRPDAAAARPRDGHEPPDLPRMARGAPAAGDHQAAGDAGPRAGRRARGIGPVARARRARSGAWSGCWTTMRRSRGQRSPG